MLMEGGGSMVEFDAGGGSAFEVLLARASVAAGFGTLVPSATGSISAASWSVLFACKRSERLLAIPGSGFKSTIDSGGWLVVACEAPADCAGLSLAALSEIGSRQVSQTT